MLDFSPRVAQDVVTYELLKDALIAFGGALVGAVAVVLYLLQAQRSERRRAMKDAARAVLCEMAANAGEAAALAAELAQPKATLLPHEARFVCSAWQAELATVAPLLSWEALSRTHRAYQAGSAVYRAVRAHLEAFEASPPPPRHPDSELSPAGEGTSDDQAAARASVRQSLLKLAGAFVAAIETWPVEQLLSNAEHADFVKRITQLKKNVETYHAELLPARQGRNRGGLWRRLFKGKQA